MTLSLPIEMLPTPGLAARYTALTAPFSVFSVYGRLNALTDATALPESKPTLSVPDLTKLSTFTGTDEGLRQSLVRGQFTESLNRRWSKLMPAIGLAALMTHASYFAGILDNQLSERSAFAGWVDRSSEGTWEPVASGDALQSSKTSDDQVIAYPEQSDEFQSVAHLPGSTEDQPRFDFREAVAYAKIMGLATDFPL